jgi:hypothetical protein
MVRGEQIKHIGTRRMDETDRLVAAVFAATMTARLQVAKIDDFFGYYDGCLEVMRRREAVGSAGAPDRTLETFWSRNR